MMNTKKFSNRTLHTFLLMLPVMATFYFTALPAHAGIPDQANTFRSGQLSGFEGYYQFDKDTSQYLQIMVKDNKLVLKQLWDEQEITFNQKSELYFYNDEKSFPLTFTKGANGEI